VRAWPSQWLTFRRAGIPTVRKINLRFRIGLTRWFDRRPPRVSEHASAAAGIEKNYIGIVSDKTDEQPAVDSLAKSDRLTKKYLLRLMAAVLNRDVGAR
jgi:hypothetical protein